MALTNWNDILNKPNGIDEVPEIALTVEQLSASVLSISEDVGEIALDVSQLSASVLSIGEDVDKLKSRTVLAIPANTYNTYELALEALEAAYDGLTESEKLRCIIRRDNSVVIKLENITVKAFSGCATTANSFIIQEMNLSTHNFYYMGYTTTTAYTDFSSQAQTQRLELIIV